MNIQTPLFAVSSETRVEFGAKKTDTSSDQKSFNDIFQQKSQRDTSAGQTANEKSENQNQKTSEEKKLEKKNNTEKNSDTASRDNERRTETSDHGRAASKERDELEKPTEKNNADKNTQKNSVDQKTQTTENDTSETDEKNSEKINEFADSLLTQESTMTSDEHTIATDSLTAKNTFTTTDTSENTVLTNNVAAANPMTNDVVTQAPITEISAVTEEGSAVLSGSELNATHTTAAPINSTATINDLTALANTVEATSGIQNESTTNPSDTASKASVLTETNTTLITNGTLTENTATLQTDAGFTKDNSLLTNTQVPTAYAESASVLENTESPETLSVNNTTLIPSAGVDANTLNKNLDDADNVSALNDAALIKPLKDTQQNAQTVTTVINDVEETPLDKNATALLGGDETLDDIIEDGELATNLNDATKAKNANAQALNSGVSASLSTDRIASELKRLSDKISMGEKKTASMDAWVQKNHTAENATETSNKTSTAFSTTWQNMQAANNAGKLSMPVNISFGRPEWAGMVAERTAMMASQSIKFAELQLDPPELGPLQVRVTVNQDQQASVTFVSANPHVREALDQTLTRLKDMLGEQGVNLTDVDVSDQSAQQQANQQGQGQSDNSANQTGARNGMNNTAQTENNGEIEQQTIMVSQASGIDYFA